ncbi:VanZ family protein [Cohnella sp. AR92]|uniref:VanZ family protein n=1 Tax=Cohnella sp. AR92 TaxID=648716 RepID=UPI000F8E2A9C|nr:VanZ family protein [Cohnella sp. AR92]RUS42650.1 VanZ family protein [Cohnella sp. AR92]
MTGHRIWRHLTALILLCGVIAVIFTLSSQPYRVQTIQPFLEKKLSFQAAERLLPSLSIRYDGHRYSRDVNPFGMIEFLFRKGAHLFVYGVLAAASALVLRSYRLRNPAIAALSLLVALIVALLDEWNQRFSPARTPAYQDVLVDLAGAALSLAVCYATSRLLHRLKG